MGSKDQTFEFTYKIFTRFQTNIENVSSVVFGNKNDRVEVATVKRQLTIRPGATKRFLRTSVVSFTRHATSEVKSQIKAAAGQGTHQDSGYKDFAQKPKKEQEKELREGLKWAFHYAKGEITFEVE